MTARRATKITKIVKLQKPQHLSGFCTSAQMLEDGLATSSATPDHFHHLCHGNCVCRCHLGQSRLPIGKTWPEATP